MPQGTSKSMHCSGGSYSESYLKNKEVANDEKYTKYLKQSEILIDSIGFKKLQSEWNLNTLGLFDMGRKSWRKVLRIAEDRTGL